MDDNHSVAPVRVPDRRRVSVVELRLGEPAVVVGGELAEVRGPRIAFVRFRAPHHPTPRGKRKVVKGENPNSRERAGPPAFAGCIISD